MNVVNLYAGGEWANAYCLGDEGGPCLFIDFGDNRGNRLLRYAEKHHSACLGVLLTHGHYDHIQGLNEAPRPLAFPVFMAAEDFRCLEDPAFNGSFDLKEEHLVIEGVAPYPCEDGDEVVLGPFSFRVLATPFHTAGSICFYFPSLGLLFSGDTLFRLGIGRDDLRGALPRKQEESLRKLMALPPETKVYPGHGPSTTLGFELAHNPYLPR